MLRDYELMFIVRPELDDDAVQTAADSVKTLIENNGGEVLKTTLWGKRRLAYEVRHLRDGHYVINKLRLDGTKVTVIERALAIHDTVFRHLLVLDEVGITEAEVEAEAARIAALAASGDEDTELAATPSPGGDHEDDFEAVAAGLDEEEED